MTTEPESDDPPRRSVLRTSLVGAAAWAGACTGLLGWLAVRDGQLADLCALVVVVVGYALHLWSSGWRPVLAAVLLVPSGFLGMGMTFEARDANIAGAGVVVAVSAVLAWGTLAIAAWVRNRWGTADDTILSGIPDW